MYKYAIQDLHRKQVHVSSVPRHCVPSEISRAIGDGTETRSIFKCIFKVKTFIWINTRSVNSKRSYLILFSLGRIDEIRKESLPLHPSVF